MKQLHKLYLDNNHFDADRAFHLYLRRCGWPTVMKFKQYQENKSKPIKFNEDIPELMFEAQIDPDNQLPPEDVMSQV